MDRCVQERLGPFWCDRETVCRLRVDSGAKCCQEILLAFGRFTVWSGHGVCPLALRRWYRSAPAEFVGVAVGRTWCGLTVRRRLLWPSWFRSSSPRGDHYRIGSSTVTLPLSLQYGEFDGGPATVTTALKARRPVRTVTTALRVPTRSSLDYLNRTRPSCCRTPAPGSSSASGLRGRGRRVRGLCLCG